MTYETPKQLVSLSLFYNKKIKYKKKESRFGQAISHSKSKKVMDTSDPCGQDMKTRINKRLQNVMEKDE